MSDRAPAQITFYRIDPRDTDALRPDSGETQR